MDSEAQQEGGCNDERQGHGFSSHAPFAVRIRHSAARGLHRNDKTDSRHEQLFISVLEELLQANLVFRIAPELRLTGSYRRESNFLFVTFGPAARETL